VEKMSIEYDGAKFDSVEELVKYKQLITGVGKQPTPVQRTPVQKTPVKRIKNSKTWTKEQDNLLIDHYIKYTINKRISRKGLSILLRKLNRTDRAVYMRVYMNPELKQRITEGLNEKKNKKKSDKPKVFDSIRAKRMSFIQSRIKNIIKQNQTINYEKAFGMASDEWSLGNVPSSNYKKQSKIKPVTLKDLEFPGIWPLSDVGIKVFETMIIDLIARGDKGKIDYFAAKNNLQLIEGYDWDGRIWKKFCEQFLINKPKICNALIGCNPRKLKVVLQNSYHVIKYQ